MTWLYIHFALVNNVMDYMTVFAKYRRSELFRAVILTKLAFIKKETFTKVNTPF